MGEGERLKYIQPFDYDTKVGLVDFIEKLKQAEIHTFDYIAEEILEHLKQK